MAWGKEEEGATFVVMVFVFASKVMHAEALLARKWLDICLPMGSRA